MTTQIALQRRKDANVYAIGVLTALFQMLATVPIAIRQQSPRIWWMPACVFIFFSLVGLAQESKEEQLLYKLFGYSASGVVAGLVAQQNKEKATEGLS